MAERELEQAKKHAVTLRARGYIHVTGVTDVESFDDRAVQLRTDCGDMTLEGEELHVTVLDTEKGTVELSGRINALYYQDGAPKKRGARGFFS